MIASVLHRLAADPEVYDRVQRAAGCRDVFARLAFHFSPEPGRLVLEIGAGTGLLHPVLPPQSRYFWLDNDPLKLGGFRRKHPGQTNAVLADATCLAFGDKSFDDVVCVAVAHHLSESQIPLLFSEAARVARHHLLFLDPVLASSAASRLLWSIDRGSYPRHASALRHLIDRHFTLSFAEEFTVRHRYLLAVASPRP